MGVSGCDLLFESNWKNIGRACFPILMISQLSDFGLSVAEHISDEELYGKHKELLQVNSGHHSPTTKQYTKALDRLFMKSGIQVCCVALFLGRPEQMFTQHR